MIRNNEAFPAQGNNINVLARSSLTEREKDVLPHVLEGKSNREISQLLEIGVCTVRTHVSNLLLKHTAKNRTELIYLLVSHNQYSLHEPSTSGKSPLKVSEILTKREYEITQLVSIGFLNKEISYQLKIQETTVKKHISSILRKMNVCNRSRLARLVI